jgi:hypothetical protein
MVVEPTLALAELVGSLLQRDPLARRALLVAVVIKVNVGVMSSLKPVNPSAEPAHLGAELGDDGSNVFVHARCAAPWQPSWVVAGPSYR